MKVAIAFCNGISIGYKLIEEIITNFFKDIVFISCFFIFKIRGPSHFASSMVLGSHAKLLEAKIVKYFDGVDHRVVEGVSTWRV